LLPIYIRDESMKTKETLKSEKPDNVIPLKVKVTGEKRPRKGTHYLWSEFNVLRLDRRSRTGKMVLSLKEDLINELGHDPTPHEMLLIRRATEIYLKLLAYDVQFAKTQGNPASMGYYVSLENSLRRLIKQLTPEKRAKKKIDIRELLLQRQREKDEAEKEKSS
jgi:hypothetical protein